jgi:hypothetical protein
LFRDSGAGIIRLICQADLFFTLPQALLFFLIIQMVKFKTVGLSYGALRKECLEAVRLASGEDRGGITRRM